MPELSLLIKPASGSCNLRCGYCFYRPMAAERGIMREETLRVIAQKALAFAEGSCSFTFQGGEPTLAGLDFFRRLVSLCAEYNTKNVAVNYMLQTNGVAVDGEWAKFLAENKFLTGLSLDGPEDIHDGNRIYPDGRDSFETVKKTAGLLDAAGAEFNILSVVTSKSAKNAERIYRFYAKNGFRFLQFIPCLDGHGTERGQNEFSLKPSAYARFLKIMFGLWYGDIKRGNIVSIRYFDNILGMFMGRPPEQCGLFGACRCQFVVEADGSVYPCDFYVMEDWKIGDIAEDSFEGMYNSPTCQKFIQASLPPHPDCEKCKWKNLCRGGCRRDRDFWERGLQKNYYCSAYKEFFEYSIPRFQELARIIKKTY